MKKSLIHSLIQNNNGLLNKQQGNNMKKNTFELIGTTEEESKHAGEIELKLKGIINKFRDDYYKLLFEDIEDGKNGNGISVGLCSSDSKRCVRDVLSNIVHGSWLRENEDDIYDIR
tara:strand:- start:80 stop:427 length:348 start_codon:yes stop_codon:yes gene_type:complete